MSAQSVHDAEDGEAVAFMRCSNDREGPPRIVSATPAAGATEVDPATSEIVVTFDRDMGRGFSWTGGGPDYPPTAAGRKPHWRDARTAVLPVKLEAGHYYRVGS